MESNGESSIPSPVETSEEGSPTTSPIKQQPQQSQQQREQEDIKEPSLYEEIGKVANAIATNPFYPELSYILHWRDPIRTGLLFGIFHFVFFLVSYGEYSILTLASYCALTLLVAAFAYANGSVLFAKYIQGLPAQNPLRTQWTDAEPFPRYIVEKHLDSILNIINAVLEVSRDVFYCVFPILSVKFASIFFVLSLLGKWFSGLTIVYLVALISFIWPRLYEEKHNEIDNYCCLVYEYTDTYLRLAYYKLPKLTDKVKKRQ